jgi:hypothetical protein
LRSPPRPSPAEHDYKHPNVIEPSQRALGRLLSFGGQQ